MKKTLKKLVISLLLGILAFSAFSGPALAAPADTPAAASGCTEANGWKLVSTSRCQAIEENKELVCPTDFPDKRVSAAEGRKQVCGKSAPTADLSAQEDVRQFTTLILAVEQFLSKLIWPVLIMIGGLLDNSLLFGGGMEERMREIWIPMRNLVNILFVVVLVGIALYNILGLGDESGNYSIKSILPKLIIGIIAVNFSFLGIKVFLDAINIGTIAIFNLPDQVNEGLGEIIDGDNVDSEVIERFCLAMEGRKASDIANENELRELSKEEIYRAAARKLKISGKTKTEIEANAKIDGKSEELNKKVKIFEDGQICDGLALSPTGEAFLSSYSSRNAALAMALNMGKIVFYQDIDDSVDNIEKLVINTLFSLMLYLIYLASFIALFIVLLARLVVMWLAIVMSPVILVGVAVPEFKDKIGFGEISEKFVGSAIAPLGIALSMSIGWIMLKAMQDVESFGGSAVVFGDLSLGIPVVGISTLQDLVVALGTVAVVWMGVFTAASKSVASFATDFMKDQLQRFGTWVGTAPFKYIPFVPVHLNDKSGTYTPAQIMHAVEGKMNQAGNVDKLLNDLGGGGITSKFFDKNEAKTADDFLSGIKALDMNKKENQESAHKWLNKSRNRNAVAKLKQNPKHNAAVTAFMSASTPEEKAKTARTLANSVSRDNHITARTTAASSTAATRKAPSLGHIKTGDAIAVGNPVTFTNGAKVKANAKHISKDKLPSAKNLITHIKTIRENLSGDIDANTLFNQVLKVDGAKATAIQNAIAAADPADLPAGAPADGLGRINALLTQTP